MKVIKLRLYKALKLLFNEQGQVENKNQLVKLVDGEEWLNFLNYLKAQGLCKVTLESVNEVKDGKAIPVTGEHLKLIQDQLIDTCRKKDDNDTELRLEIIKGEVKKEEQKNDDEAAAKKAKMVELRAKLKEAKITFSPAATLEVLEEKAKALEI